MISAARFEKAKSRLEAKRRILKIGNLTLISSIPKPRSPRSPARTSMMADVSGKREKPNINADMERR